MKNSVKGLIGIIIALAIILSFAFYFIINIDKAKTISVTQFEDELRANNVQSVSISNDTIRVLKRGSDIKPANFPSSADWVFNGRESDISAIIMEHNETEWKVLITKLDGKPDSDGFNFNEWYDSLSDTNKEEWNTEWSKVRVDRTLNDRYQTSIWQIILNFLPIILLIVFAFFIFRMMSKSNNSAMNFGKTQAQMSTSTKVHFSDVAGAEEEKEELKEIVDFLKSPSKFTAVGARIPKGVLLVGPPGTGKTLFAKAVAGEANVPFFSISGSDFVEMFVGVGASRVRDLFEQAKRNMPCIIFIDEIDAVGRQRGAGLGGGHDEREQTLNQLLVHMDGFVSNEGIIVMAATNRADVLDPALLRPGRFDRQIYVHIPDVRGREAIFMVHSRNKPMSKDIEFKVLARLTSGFSGADIENLLNEAAILCARDSRTQINMRDIYEGINKVVLGPQKKSRLVTEMDKRNTAYHEAGHAIVARSLPECDPVHEVSIIPRGQAAGYTMMRPDNDDNDYTINKLTAQIAMAMGGRAAEELVIHDYSAGAAGDIKTVTNIAKKMVTEWGMSKEVGPVFYGNSGEVFLGRDYSATHSNTSEAVTGKIDAEVRRLIEEGHQTALRILTEKRAIMDNMARVLIERETIYTEEVAMLMEGKNWSTVVEHIDSKVGSRSAFSSVVVPPASN
ncbi:MAG: ATP-dependent zinc metalloprotease FtsH [Clostridiales bacterium]|nr:ATP-dependent zinc metalloprotease FtsH [Clostridiales bacterium]